MYECKVCGGELRFVIKDQKLHCAHCDGVFDPDSYDRDLFAGRSELDVTLYRCPNCGGEIAATHLSAVETCSYCGRTIVPEALQTSVAMPQEIIPFQIDKDECIERYRKHLHRYANVPARMKKTEFLERFRPVYVPYWSYDFGFTDKPKLPTKKEHREGDYIVTEHFEITGDMEAEANGVLFDASSQLHDNIGHFVMPFHKSSCKPFNPSYLFGFFADRADTDSVLYMSDASQDATAFVFQNLERSLPGEKIKTDPTRMAKSVGTTMRDAHCVMLPMWFLTWREGEQVAYAVVNGETGKVYSDMPLSVGKFVSFSGITAAALFALALLFLPTLSIYTALLLTAAFGLLSLILYCFGIEEIDRAILHFGDKGYRTVMGYDALPQKPKKRKKKKKEKEKGGASGVMQNIGRLLMLSYLIFIGVIATSFLFERVSLGTAYGRRSCLYLLLACLAIYYVYRLLSRKESADILLARADGTSPFISKRVTLRDAAGSILGILVALLIHIVNPAHDLWYYGAMLLTAAGVLWSLLTLLMQYNELATHPEPHFFKGAGQ